MNRTVATDQAPEALGPYSQAVVSGDFIFTAGQIGIDPATGALVAGGIGPETRQALANIAHVLEAAGAGMRSVAKVTAYLADLADYAQFNRAYEKFFEGHKPARAAVQVVALPGGARVEIDAVASRY